MAKSDSELVNMLRKGGAKEDSPNDNNEIVDLKAQLAELTQFVSGLKQTTQNVPTDRSNVVGATNIHKFVSRRDLADAMDNADELANVLNTALSELAESRFSQKPVDVEKIKEDIVTSISSTLDGRINNAVVSNNAIVEFYRDNREFLPFKYQAGEIVAEIQSKNPEWSIDQLLTKTKEVMHERHGKLINAAKNIEENEDKGKGKDKGKDFKKPPTQPTDGDQGGDKGGEENPIAAMVARYGGPPPSHDNSK